MVMSEPQPSTRLRAALCRQSPRPRDIAHRFPRVVALLLPAILLGRPAAAQQPERGAELTISLVTMGPGHEVWERFGHNAIWVHDTLRHQDIQYNYGLFSFRQENFILRFVQGRMLYSMGGFDAAPSMAQYAGDNRSVWVQALNLTPAQRADLRDFLEWNALPENRNYHYDYYRDNCSTRVRDALDRVLGGRIRAATERVPSGTTYRFHTARLTSSEPLVYTGLMLGLGEPVDRPISAYEEMFLPLALRTEIRGIEVPDAQGAMVPLVRSEDTAYRSTAPAPATAPPSWLPAYLAIGLALGGLLLLLGRAAPGSAGARWGLVIPGTLWALLTGLAGTILTGLWALTDHVAAYANENLFQFNPIALALVVLLPLAVLGGGRWVNAARRLAAILVALSVAGIAFKLVPGVRQSNAMLIALALPVHLGVWLGLRSVTRRRSGAPVV